MDLITPTSASTQRYLGRFVDLYPGILDWHDRIEREITSGVRSVFAIRGTPDIGGIAITKNGAHAKLCHISVAPDHRNSGYGQLLMRTTIEQMLRQGAHDIKVTTSEEVFRLHGDFFRGAGFQLTDWELHRYRRGVAELVWTMDAARARGYLSCHRGLKRRAG